MVSMMNDNNFIQFLRLLKKDDKLTKEDVKVIQGLSASDSRITNLFTAFVKYKNKEISPANYQMIYNSMASKYQNMLEEPQGQAQVQPQTQAQPSFQATGLIDFSSIDLSKDKDDFIKYLTYVTDIKAGTNVCSAAII